jgi:predicted RNase H-like nuclease (RuvC/YqgF family)
MATARLPLERIKPKNAKKMRHAIKTRGQNTPKAESFRNPLLGIEVNLMKQLADVTSKYHSTSYHTRNVLLTAIEDISKTGLGFERILTRVAEKWRPPETAADDVFETLALADLMKMQRSCREAAGQRASQSERVQDLLRQIKKTEASTEKYLGRIEELKSRLKTASDFFALPRKLTRSIGELHGALTEMFRSGQDQNTDAEIEALDAENVELRKQRLQQEIELRICANITWQLDSEKM